MTIEELVKDYLEYSENNFDMEGLRNGQIIRLNKTAIRNNIATNINETYDEGNELTYLHAGDLIANDTNNDIYEFDYTTETPNVHTNISEAAANKTKTKFLELYNLLPAVGAIKIVKPINKTKESWYVPETYPCWELPLLYGEIVKKNISEVFTSYPLFLKNVIDDHPDVQRRRDRLQNITYNRASKWCSILPCHGDHTLCLYPTDRYSVICNSFYKVYTLRPMQQVALVNTINAMRNLVAQGTPDEYPYLPPAANMKQIIYNIDLEEMADRWLKQCLPGPAPCLSLESKLVSQLECFKRIESCCWRTAWYSNCIPLPECFVDPVVGCVHAWFMSAGTHLQPMHIGCGHIEKYTFHTIQLIWANTNKIGCAYAKKRSGEIRVICNFAPGAPFYLDTKYYCGILRHNNMRHYLPDGGITNLTYLKKLGFILQPMKTAPRDNNNLTAKNMSYPECSSNYEWGIVALRQQYPTNWVRNKLNLHENGSTGVIARLVTRYDFQEETCARCDVDEPIYEIGAPGSLCKKQGNRFSSLCYEYKVATGYRIISVLAPMILLTLILFDLFSSVLRQYH
ncbi:uncharacterized protein LOC113239725 [Hyposmocoma kahamanoa]|uniref:uncharacterized protein LOC113239725 n=1 Tax=Hyposmocoma kahamanoa TaxID=1477025 RepID=UPI000E6D64EC|nr:uncharacterized protein LOC113239725 [Hyposmocoma kahamanoa]